MASKRELPGRIGSVVYLPGFSNRYVRVADRSFDLPYPWCDPVSGLMSEADLVEFFDEIRDECGEWQVLRPEVTDEMVETCAKALYEDAWPDEDWETEARAYKNSLRYRARVVLEAAIGKEQADEL